MEPLLAETSGRATIPHGLSTQSLFPLYLGLPPFADSWVWNPGEGRWRLAFATTWSNTLRYDSGRYDPGLRLIVDGEALDGRVGFQRGLGGDLVASVWLSADASFPGILDPCLSGFHRLFGLPDQYRALFADNMVRRLVENDGSALVDEHGSSAGLSSWGAGLTWAPASMGQFAFTMRFKAPIPGRTSILFADRAALGLSAAWNPRWGGADLGLGLGIAWLEPGGPLESLPARSFLAQGSAHVFFTPLPAIALGIEAAAMQSPVRLDEPYLGGVLGNLWIGGNVDLGGGWSLELAIVEELLSWASVEIGLVVGLELRG